MVICNDFSGRRGELVKVGNRLSFSKNWDRGTCCAVRIWVKAQGSLKTCNLLHWRFREAVQRLVPRALPSLTLCRLRTGSCRLGTLLYFCAVLRLLAYNLAGLVLVVNLGVPVFTHACSGMGTTTTSFFLPFIRCCEHGMPVEDDCEETPEPICCGANGKSGCCDNNISFEQLHGDLFFSLTENNIHVDKLLLSGVAYSHLTPEEVSISSISFYPHAPPGPDPPKAIRLKYQVFRC